jgi:hypothetical protein
MNQKTKEYQRKWRQNNQQWLKKYREQNREKTNKQSQERYLRNKEHNDAVRKKWYLENRSRIISKLRAKKETLEGKIYQWKLGAKRRNIKWNLTIEEVKSLPMACHYTGIPLTLKIGETNTMSIDRIDSSKPYELSNVVPCCSMINEMKFDYTKSEFIEMCKQVANHQSNE